MYKILLVDDEQDIRNIVKIGLEREKYEVTTASSADEAVKIIKDKDFDIYITDLKMPGSIDGMGLLEIIKSEKPESEVIIISAYYEAFHLDSNEKIKKCEFVQKPFSLKFLIGKVREIIQRKTLRTEIEEMQKISVENKSADLN